MKQLTKYSRVYGVNIQQWGTVEGVIDDETVRVEWDGDEGYGEITFIRHLIWDNSEPKPRPGRKLNHKTATRMQIGILAADGTTIDEATFTFSPYDAILAFQAVTNRASQIETLAPGD